MSEERQVCRRVDVPMCRRETWVSRSSAATYPLHRLMNASVEMCAYESVRLLFRAV